MGFRINDLFETAEQEVDRLASAPEGSISHGLSGLPVNISGNLEGQIVVLPRLPYADGGVSDRTVVVVPMTHNTNKLGRSDGDGDGAKLRRHDGWWSCIVVSSDNASYPVGGYTLSIPESELVRGTVAQLIL